jgi:endonuclease/exonuclease/phosphatase (EEP) superfamily protein YafD
MTGQCSSPTGITVMTYNLGDGLASPERLSALLRERRPAVVGLQEVDKPTGDALAGAADTLTHQVIYPLGIPGKAVLSRFPILSSRLLESDPTRPDLVVTLDLAGVEVTVIVAHPPPPYLKRTGLVTREGTPAQVADLIGAVRATTGPVLLLGDFNAVARNAIPRRLSAAGLIDVAKHRGRPLATYPTRLTTSGEGGSRLRKLPVRPVLRLDYIWASHHWRVISTELGPDAGSDHLPVLATLALADDVMSLT